MTDQLIPFGERAWTLEQLLAAEKADYRLKFLLMRGHTPSAIMKCSALPWLMLSHMNSCGCERRGFDSFGEGLHRSVDDIGRGNLSVSPQCCFFDEVAERRIVDRSFGSVGFLGFQHGAKIGSM